MRNLLARPMLALLNTKPEPIDGATLYLKIYAFGMPAMALYNFGNGVLSATGDTKRPLIYLSAAGVVNVALNLFFVIQCHMAADGVALASVIAQYLSALLMVLHLLRRGDECRLSWRKLRFHPRPAAACWPSAFPPACRTLFSPSPTCLCRWASTPLTR